MDRHTYILGLAFAAGLFLNAAVGLGNLFYGRSVRASGTPVQAVFLSDKDGNPLAVNTVNGVPMLLTSIQSNNALPVILTAGGFQNQPLALRNIGNFTNPVFALVVAPTAQQLK